jgi:hypothetical protein
MVKSRYLLNNAGQSVGTSGSHGTIYSSHGNQTDLSSGFVPATVNNTGWAVGNDKGFLNGRASIQPVDVLITSGEANAVLWGNNTIYTLNSCSCIGNSSGWEFDFAYAVNDAGQIVGTGFHNGVETGFVLNPESVPAVKAVVTGASFEAGGVAGAMATVLGTNLTSSTGINITSSLPLPARTQRNRRCDEQRYRQRFHNGTRASRSARHFQLHGGR